MDFFDAVKARRSIRKFTDELVPESVIQKALEAAVLAPNSSNVQTWDFYWVKSVDQKKKLVRFCLDQSAARTARHLIVVTADPARINRSREALVKWAREASAPKSVLFYYEKMIPLTYMWGIFNSVGFIKWSFARLVSLFRPMMRGPSFLGNLQEVGIKSAALAAENFVLAISAQGYSTCMMEGFDESRVKRMLKLKSSARVVMVIAVGRASERGTWGPQFRLPLGQVVHEV